MKNNPNIDFAIIGHQESWGSIISIINKMRRADLPKIPEEEIKLLFPNFPPRSLFDIEVKSIFDNKIITGKYIESFITPDEISASSLLNKSINKVIDATHYAIEKCIPISTLGGFTSILIEGDTNRLPSSDISYFTTGNSLTAALIVEGVTDAASLLGIKLDKAKMMIIGASGDLGMACTAYFKDKVAKLILTGRNEKKLLRIAGGISDYNPVVSTDLDKSSENVDIILSTASSSNLNLNPKKEMVLIADAGYPKNLEQSLENRKNVHLFHAGMGNVIGGYSSNPDYHKYFYAFPAPNIGHGCILEVMVLAFEKLYTAYSHGRGNITLESMEIMNTMAVKHGIVRAPFYNTKGLWSDKIQPHPKEISWTK